ncbi:hypothetical protein [Micromonospora sp. NBRC 101691]|uniref:hypothetical protein n=1 Tax=Micromonospora sp. NBRC 101691 TaxID=3032198 RepID=UPI0024A31354|nr:hypothetical protein [Micromonospora sp. NBRC 101691]GLY21715.1 hypothetical protein Misp04_14470 [Micromonospora sp. NBRC 101691]
MSFLANIYDSDGRSVARQELHVAVSGDALRDIDAAGDAARRLLQPGQYADLYERTATGGASYVDTVHHPKGV